MYTWNLSFIILSVNLGHGNQDWDKKLGNRKARHTIAWLAWTEPGHRFLVLELDPAGDAHPLGLFPVMAGLLSQHRWPGLLAQRHIAAYA